MPIKIRLRRMGRKKQPHYRIVVADTDSPRDGRFVESLGFYKPLSHPARLVLDLERVAYWEGKGALPTETVATLLRKARKGGDSQVAVGDVDREAEKKAEQEALAAKRRKEAEAQAKAEAEAAAEAAAKQTKAAKKKAKAETAVEGEPEGGEAAPEAAASEEPAAEAAADAGDEGKTE
jgi:small subunit ribosomal protein S16